MAEIHIEKKTRPIWPWVILGLIILGVIVYLIYYFTGGDVDRMGAFKTLNFMTAVIEATKSFVLNNELIKGGYYVG